MFDSKAKRRRLQNLGIKTLLPGKVFLAANLDDEMLQFRKAIQDHCQYNLAEEACTAKEQDGLVSECVDCRDFARSFERPRGTRFIFTAN
jgi:hypothetical protein